VKNFSGVRSPAAIVGGSSDTVAPVGSHSITFYNSINQAEKLLAVIRGASHFFPQDNPANQPASKYQIAWMKRWVDGDTRYSQFLVNDAVAVASTGLFDAKGGHGAALPDLRAHVQT
jgi:predicted dienelactone hydrolase